MDLFSIFGVIKDLGLGGIFTFLFIERGKMKEKLAVHEAEIIALKEDSRMFRRLREGCGADSGEMKTFAVLMKETSKTLREHGESIAKIEGSLEILVSLAQGKKEK